MASTLEVTQKIQSLNNIQKVTGAMNLIASIRLRKLASKQNAAELFERGVVSWLDAVVPVLARVDDPLVQPRAVSRIVVVVFTSDRGLCGSHNHSVHRALDLRAEQARARGQTLEVVCCGTKGASYAARRGLTVIESLETKHLAPTSDVLAGLAGRLVATFLSKETDAVDVIYNRYISTLRQTTLVRPLLPLRVATAGAAEPALDPALGLGAEVGASAVRFLLEVCLAHSMLSEQAARMTAMDNASKNARDLTNQAVKERNRVRQAGITGELIEIISGKEAMKR